MLSSKGWNMNHNICDLCGQELLQTNTVRYEVKIEVRAAYDPLNVTDEDLEQDFRAEFGNVLRQLDGLSTEDAQSQVYRLFEFDLCPVCQRGYVANPLRKKPTV
jgi:hypothetical protein